MTALPRAGIAARPDHRGQDRARSQGGPAVSGTGRVVTCWNSKVEQKLNALVTVLEHVDQRLLHPQAETLVWDTGFGVLNDALGGGLRAGGLHMLAGSQGEGKTTFALQVARQAAYLGHPVVFFSFELEAESLLHKMVAAEAIGLNRESTLTVQHTRSVFEGTDGQSGGLPERLNRFPGGLDALARVNEYASRLMVHRSTTTHTNLAVINQIVTDVAALHGKPPLVVVDYLQKVRPARFIEDPEASVTAVVEGFKDLAIDHQCPVLAISSSEIEGLQPGHRLRARHMKGSASIAYEADVVLVLANKADVVARHHLMYGANNGDHFREWSVLTIEKNRSGRTGADLEFRKDFLHGRFVPEGTMVAEDLVDERVFVE